MTSRHRILTLDASAKIRLAFVVLCGFFSVMTQSVIATLPWILVVVLIDLVVVALGSSRGGRHARFLDGASLALLGLSAACAGAAYAATGLASAMLILVPAYHAGTRFGRFGFAVACAAGSVAWYLTDVSTSAGADRRLEFGAWILVALLLGMLGAWNQRLAAEQESERSDPAAVEAIELIERLQDLSSQMSTGLDAPAGASLALDLLAAEVPSTRSAVLVTQDAEHLVPVALRGSTRAPWHIADRVSELLRANPASWVPTEVTFVDELGRRRALVVPFALGNGMTSVLVAERSTEASFSEAERATAAKVTRRIAPTLQAGLLFGTLRRHASLEERNRIARDIHDGIAQELAALGYQVDALRAKAGPPGNEIRDGLDGIRTRLGESMADLRMNITDLRVAERPDTGLGSVLGAAVQSFGSVTGVRTTVTVSEGRRRLDPRVELLVHRLVMDVLADAQASGASNAWVTLATSVAGPACVDVSHDGDPARSRRSFSDPALDDLDATLFVRSDRAGRTTVNLTVQEPVSSGTLRISPS